MRPQELWFLLVSPRRWYQQGVFRNFFVPRDRLASVRPSTSSISTDPIDYIFVKVSPVRPTAPSTTGRKTFFPSDHFPVLAELKFD
ncbi:MAG: hypothetical protein K0M63_01070 [Weeksellaceae bacterium]|nr:hypothetical protein [Weeksellaceae bacterium]